MTKYRIELDQDQTTIKVIEDENGKRSSLNDVHNEILKLQKTININRIILISKDDEEIEYPIEQYENENHLENSVDNSWSVHFSKLIKNGVLAALLIGGGYYVAYLSRTGSLEINVWVAGAIFFVGGIYALIAAWHAVIAILWPALILFGVAGVSTVKSIDDSGGIRSIVHRIWYGKKHP